MRIATIDFRGDSGLFAKYYQELVDKFDVVLVQNTPYVDQLELLAPNHAKVSEAGNTAIIASKKLQLGAVGATTVKGIAPKRANRHYAWADLKDGNTAIRVVSVSLPIKSNKVGTKRYYRSLSTFFAAAKLPVVAGGSWKRTPKETLRAVSNFGTRFRGVSGFIVRKDLKGATSVATSTELAYGLELNTAPVANTKTDTLFTTVTANIKCNPEMPQGYVVADVTKITSMSEVSIIGWQEINIDRYRAAINARTDWTTDYQKRPGANVLSYAPISYRHDVWEKVEAGVHLLNKGGDGTGPDRFAQWIALKNKETGQIVCRVNAHFPARAWSVQLANTLLRQRNWLIAMDSLMSLVSTLKSKYDVIIIGGDFNRSRFDVMGDMVEYDNERSIPTLSSQQYDYLMHTHNARVQPVKPFKNISLNSDHDAVYGTYRITKG